MTHTELERRTEAGPVTRVAIRRSTVFGRQYRERESDLPTLTADVEVPPELVDLARELYLYYHDPSGAGSPPEQSFAEYLHDVVMDRLTLELHYPRRDASEQPDSGTR